MSDHISRDELRELVDTGSVIVVETLGALETTLDPTERAELAEAAQRLLVEEYALVNPIYNPSQVIAQSSTVHGIIFDAQARNHFVDTWKSE